MALYTMPDLRRRAGSLQKSFNEASLKRLSNAADNFDIFLSQRKLDAEIVQVLHDDITSMGYSVYVDWINDRDVDRSSVDKATADLLRRRLKQAKSLIYVSSSASVDSKWMPWELGFKDGQSSRVAILPIAATDVSSESYSGLEYLGLYPYITKAKTNGEFPKQKLWVHTDEKTYVVFDDWLKGKAPFAR